MHRCWFLKEPRKKPDWIMRNDHGKGVAIPESHRGWAWLTAKKERDWIRGVRGVAYTGVGSKGGVAMSKRQSGWILRDDPEKGVARSRSKV